VSASPAERPGAVLDRVDAELRALWSTPPTAGDGRDLTRTPARSSAKPRVRACTMNLVVVATTRALAEPWVPLVDRVLLGIPARAIVVGLDPAGADGLEAQTSAVCIPGDDGGPQICSERVTFFVRGGVAARLYSCVTAVCAADVPTTLVWVGGVRAGDSAFEALARDASRIVLDAAQGSLESLASVVHSKRLRSGAGSASGAGVADLAWTRLAPWQEMCARMFDEPRLRPLASRVTRVVLVQASPAGAALGAEGLLLLGWLATRLGWKATAQAGQTTLFLRGEEAIEVVLSPDPSSTALRGALLAAHIEARADGVTLNGQIVRDAGEDDAASWRLEVTAEGGEPQRLEQRVRLRATDKAALLERTLHRPLHDPALEQSVLWSDEWGGAELGSAPGEMLPSTGARDRSREPT
jgi:glucose-6-phosphate dehydrogenase assembly protein OpcA